MTDTTAIEPLLRRIAEALERMHPGKTPAPSFDGNSAFVWHADSGELIPVANINRIELGLLKGIDHARNILHDNTSRFAEGFPANNALLWGARGMGKSSLIKAVHAAVCDAATMPLILIEIHREDIISLSRLLPILRDTPDKRFILFCDDLSFDGGDDTYKSLKAMLEGGIEGRPENVLFYATSNRRHLMPRDMIENERSTAIAPAEAVHEKVSLSDRFGLWIGFHNCDQEIYLVMIDAYAERYGLDIGTKKLHAEALEWSVTRGARSGRVAWQFTQDLAGRLGKQLR
jgi:hypothetical protein